MLEGTDVSLRKGTPFAYQALGAPWIHAVELAAYLNQRKIEGVRFVPVAVHSRFRQITRTSSAAEWTS